VISKDTGGVKIINVGVIGIGSWGKNHVRNYKEMENVNLKAISDIKKENLMIAKEYNIYSTTNFKEILNDADIDAVSICVPASLHYKISKEALEAGKHIFFVLNSEQGSNLINLARKKRLILTVGHIFRFDPTVNYIKKEIERGTFGKIYYISLSRLGLKDPRKDVGAIFNYAVHDLDIICYLLDKLYPDEITAVSSYPLDREFEDHAIVTTRFERTIGHTQVGWLTPMKLREFWVVGENKSANIDPTNLEVEIFKSGRIPEYKNWDDFKLITREGSSSKPKILKKEPLNNELKYFIDCIKKNKKVNKIDGYVGLRTIKMCEAAIKSAAERKTIVLDKNGNYL